MSKVKTEQVAILTGSTAYQAEKKVNKWINMMQAEKSNGFKIKSIAHQIIQSKRPGDNMNITVLIRYTTTT